MNGFTKLCGLDASANLADMNGDGFGDAEQYQYTELDAQVVARDIVAPQTPAPGSESALDARKRELRSRYAKNAYFVELYDGWAEPNVVAPSAPASARTHKWVVRERPRTTAASGSEVVRLPYDNDETAHPAEARGFATARTCARRSPRLSGYPNAPAFAPRSTTHDYAWASAVGSQFKCMRAYPSGDPNLPPEATRPRDVLEIAPSGAVTSPVMGTAASQNARAMATSGPGRWTFGACTASPTATSPITTLAGPNPQAPKLTCAPRVASSSWAQSLVHNTPAAGLPLWATVSYVHYELGSGVQSGPLPATAQWYSFGCVNECAEQGPARCPGGVPADPLAFNYTSGTSLVSANGRTACDLTGPNVRAGYGELRCGCGPSFSGPDCRVGCASKGAEPGSSSELLMSPAYDLTTPTSAQNRWVCLHPVGTSTPTATMSGGGFTMRGDLSLGAFSGSTTGGDFVTTATHRLRSR